VVKFKRTSLIFNLPLFEQLEDQSALSLLRQSTTSRPQENFLLHKTICVLPKPMLASPYNQHKIRLETKQVQKLNFLVSRVLSVLSKKKILKEKSTPIQKHSVYFTLLQQKTK